MVLKWFPPGGPSTSPGFPATAPQAPIFWGRKRAAGAKNAGNGCVAPRNGFPGLLKWFADGFEMVYSKNEMEMKCFCLKSGPQETISEMVLKWFSLAVAGSKTI